jgi:soluble lytic murein transglycosylase-like protein
MRCGLIRTSVLIQFAMGVAIGPRAADAATPHGQAQGVIMMIGGDAADDGIEAAPVRSTQTDVGRLAVVLEPAVPRQPSSTSIVSRVMALAPLIDEAAQTTGLDRALLMAVIDVESNGDPRAVSPQGASGLMQLMPGTAARHGATNLFDPRQNLAAGARYLARLMKQFGDLRLALAAYNAGEGAVRKYGGQIPPYAETMEYVPKVIERYRHYRNIADATARNDVTLGRFLLVRDE